MQYLILEPAQYLYLNLESIYDGMIPNLDPRALKRMMDSMGMKNTEIDAARVVIEGKEKDIIIEQPAVTMIDMQGVKSFQISGNIREIEKSVEISEDDVKIVMEQAGVAEESKAREALKEVNGDIASAILKLKGNI